MDLDPPEIEPPLTPGRSIWANIFGSEFSTCHLVIMMLFSVFCGLMWAKLVKNRINWSTELTKYLNNKQNMQNWQAVSLEDDKRKILSKKCWSHGTSLESIGPLSEGDLGP